MGILTISMQIPFLTSDPDSNLSESRGANTDEGLNTCQIRNFVNHNDLTLDKSDNFVKTPLFGAILFLPIKIFGSNLLTGRLTILILSVFLCFIIYSKNNYWIVFGLVSIVMIYSEYYIFHFFHLCLAEILSSILIFFSLFILIESKYQQFTIRSSFISSTTISLAYFLKIQFLYAVIILPISTILYILVDKERKKQWIKHLEYTLIFLISYLFIYYFFWYLPNRDLFDYVMSDQTYNRFVDFSNLIPHVKFKLNHIFYNNFLKYFTFLFYVSFLIGIIYSVKTSNSSFRFIFIGISSWLAVELHKLLMTYLPTRYLISLFFSMGLIITLVLVETLLLRSKYKSINFLKIIPVLLLFFFAIQNGINFSSSYKNREFSIKNINDYLSNYNFYEKPVMGAWAPSLSWKSKAISYPIWKDYFNDKNVIEMFRPAIIISEINEDDSNQAFLSQGIIIDNFADSIKYFTVNKWKLKLLWMKQFNHSDSSKSYPSLPQNRYSKVSKSSKKGIF